MVRVIEVYKGYGFQLKVGRIAEGKFTSTKNPDDNFVGNRWKCIATEGEL